MYVFCVYIYIYIYIPGCIHVNCDQGQPKEKINQEIGEKRKEDEGYRQKDLKHGNMNIVKVIQCCKYQIIS